MRTLDLPQIDAISCGDPECLLPILDVLAESAPQQITEVQQAVDQGELDRAAQVLHSLKGTSGTFGLEAVHQLCKNLEKSCRKGETPKVIELQKFPQLFERSIKSARNYLSP